MNLQHVRTFLAVCDRGSFTAAAKQVFRSQPAVSRQVRQLESDLGVVLLEQIGKKLFLTDAGSLFEPEARRLVGDADRLAERLGQYQESTWGRLRVGASSTPAGTVVPRALGRMREVHPELELHLEIGPTSTICASLLDNDLDLAIVGARPEQDALVARPVARDRIACFASPTAKGGGLWILGPPASATRRHAEAWLDEAGIRLDRTLELGSVDTIKALVKEGVGRACLSTRLVSGELDRGELIELAIDAPPLWRELFVVRHANKHITPAMEAFTAQLDGT
ncbi:MAG TPA: LysR family transcriptional regulator [Myxococcota bacterium]|nr:LysR family transcriptional regulator [Myxococcota bacterium]